MLRHPLAIGLGAGLASAVLFLSITTGTALAFLLYLILPLPGLIVGFGWGLKAAVVAVALASLVISLTAGFGAEAGYLLGYGLPVLLLTAVGVGSGPGQASGAAVTPGLSARPGMILSVATLLAGAFGALMVLRLGVERSAYDASVKQLGGEIAAMLPPPLREGLDPARLEQVIAALASSLPGAMASVWLALMVLNLLIARSVLFASGRLDRPGPDLAMTDGPLVLLITFLVSVAASFHAGLLGPIASAFAGAHVTAFVLIGLGVVHAVTRGRALRGFVLTVAYGALVLITPFAAAILVLLGLVDPLLHLRARYTRAPDPRNPKPNS